MAGSGISKVMSSAVPGMSGVSNAAAAGARQRAPKAVETTGQSVAQHRSKQHSAPARQVVNVEGKMLDRNAPRGTYLNIVA